MPTVDKLVAATKGLKVKEVPQAVGKFVGEHVPDLDRRARPDVRSLARPLSLALTRAAPWFVLQTLYAR